MNFFNNKQQHGGMLLELMLTIAIAAILIPFIARYQQNTIERARNISVVKQMATVQKALERCIDSNQEDLLSVVLSVGDTRIYSPNDNNAVECLFFSKTDNGKLKGLINYGLDEGFVADYQNDYVLRILRTEGTNGTSVLQGVVLLKNDGITALRTREIVNIGGGKLGYTQDDNIYGGFTANAGDFGLKEMSNDQNKTIPGIVGTTAAVRRKINQEYIARVNTNSFSDSLLISDLNMGGQSIEYIDKLVGGNRANMIFGNYCGKAGDYPKPTIAANYVTFNNPVVTDDISGSLVTSSMGAIPSLNMLVGPRTTVRGTGTLKVLNTARPNGDLSCQDYTTGNLTVTDLNGVRQMSTPSDTETWFTSSGSSEIKELTATELVFNGDLTVPKLEITDCIKSKKSENENEVEYYSEITPGGCTGKPEIKSAWYKTMVISGLGEHMKTVYDYENRDSNAAKDNCAVNLISARMGTFLSEQHKEGKLSSISVNDLLEVLEKIESELNVFYTNEDIKKRLNWN